MKSEIGLIIPLNIYVGTWRFTAIFCGEFWEVFKKKTCPFIKKNCHFWAVI
jgi:hypothetical protein